MRHKSRETIPDKLAAAHAAITNALGDIVIQSQLRKSGLDISALNRGRALLDAATAAAVLEVCASRVLKQAELYLEKARADAIGAFNALAETLKWAVKKNARVRRALRLDSVIPLEGARFIAAAYRLFDRIAGDQEMRRLLVKSGYGVPKLRAGRARIVGYENAVNGLHIAKLAARQSVKELELALKKLDSYMSGFRKVALSSVKGDRLEKLGLSAARKTKTGVRRAGSRTASYRKTRK